MQRVWDLTLVFNLILSTVIFYVAAQIYFIPYLNSVPPQVILLPILILHSFRHLGMMFLTRGATKTGMPLQFAYPAALGDLLTAVLAFIAIFFVWFQLPSASYLLWAFNIIGTLDLILAIILGNLYKVQSYLGASYWIPAFWVPALLVTHYIVFLLLLNYVTG